jgi:hypothetical protein
MSNYFLGVCSGTGLIGGPTTIALLEMQRILIARGHGVTYAVHAQADVAVARNSLAHLFLNSGADIFIGIDDDVGISAHAFEVMTAQDHDCLVAIVPQRLLDLGVFADRVRSGDDVAQAQRNASPPRDLPPDQAYGFFDAERGTTSFYMVKRRVYERMVTTGHVRQHGWKAENQMVPYWGFYNPGEDERGAYLSEDYAFFSRVRRSGTGITAYYGPGLSHSGIKTYHS